MPIGGRHRSGGLEWLGPRWETGRNNPSVTDYRFNHPGGLHRIVVLPDLDQQPIHSSQDLFCLSIPLSVSLNLRVPVGLVGGRWSIVIHAAVPITAVHVDSDPSGRRKTIENGGVDPFSRVAATRPSHKGPARPGIRPSPYPVTGRTGRTPKHRPQHAPRRPRGRLAPSRRWKKALKPARGPF